MSATNLTPQQIDDMLRRIPCVKLPDGSVRTCPVRLSFPYLFDKQPPMEQGQEPKWAATLLFPLGADLNVLYQDAQRAAMEKWPNAFQPGGPTLTNPFRNQGEKQQHEGYVPGAMFITCSASRIQPPVVHVSNPALPVVDRSKVYPGVWAVVTVRAFAYEKRVKKGVSFGLQSVLLLADDKALGGGAVDPAQQYQGITPIEGLTQAPAAMFGAQGHGMAPPPQSNAFGGYGAPPAPPQQGYAPLPPSAPPAGYQAGPPSAPPTTANGFATTAYPSNPPAPPPQQGYGAPPAPPQQGWPQQ